MYLWNGSQPCILPHSTLVAVQNAIYDDVIVSLSAMLDVSRRNDSPDTPISAWYQDPLCMSLDPAVRSVS
jgi:hypothetical protein